MHRHLWFFIKMFLVAAIVLGAMYLLVPAVPVKQYIFALTAFLLLLLVVVVTGVLMFSPTRTVRLKELSLFGKHGLRKTDANSFTYFVDHPPLADGSPDMKHLRFFWEHDGDEVQTILSVDQVSFRAADERDTFATVEFVFNASSSDKCSVFGALTKDPNWWFDKKRSTLTGFSFAMIRMAPAELASEIHLNTKVQYF